MPGGGARMVGLRSGWVPRVRTGAVGVAMIAAGSALMAACEDLGDDDGLIRGVSGESSSRLLGLGINTCNADLSAEVEETAEEVRIRIHAANNTMGDCADSMRVTLDDALGHRRVVDDRTGAELRVSSPLAEPGAAGIGDPVRDGNLMFTVTAVGEEGPPSFGGQPSFLEPPVRLVLVYVTVRNDGHSPGSFAEEYQYLFDGDGRKSAGYLDRGDPSLAEINPGDTVEGVLVFDVASDTVPARIELHASPSSGGITVALG